MTRKKATLLAYMIIFVPALILMFLGFRYISAYNKQAKYEYSRVKEITVEFRNQADFDVEGLEITVYGDRMKDLHNFKMPIIKAKGSYSFVRNKDVEEELTTADLSYKMQKETLPPIRKNTENKTIVYIKPESTKEKLVFEIINATGGGLELQK